MIVFNKTTLLSLHKQLLDVAESENRGQFKKEPNIISETRNGKKYVVFIPTAPKDVEESIDQMLIAFNEASHNPNINPLLLISCFVLDFLCVHPFDDGNGRMSRLLTLLLLYKKGFDIAYARGKYYQSRLLMFKGDKKGARRLLKSILSIDYRYVFLYVLTFFPVSLWNYVHYKKNMR